MTGCYYRRRGDGLFTATDLTRSNWTPNIQHGSPPLALLTKHVEDLVSPGQRLARLTFDILGAIPVADLTVQAWVQRPGRRISLLAAELSPQGEDRPVAQLSAWALATSDTTAVVTDRYPPLQEGATADSSWQWDDSTGYLATVRWRPQHSAPDEPRLNWSTPMVSLIDDEPTTALQRLTMVVDSANGIGAVLDSDQFVFMNTDTSVHLHRLPTGNDFGLRARASIGPDGIGITTAEIFDHAGFVGTSAQTLLVQQQP